MIKVQVTVDVVIDMVKIISLIAPFVIALLL